MLSVRVARPAGLQIRPPPGLEKFADPSISWSDNSRSSFSSPRTPMPPVIRAWDGCTAYDDQISSGASTPPLDMCELMQTMQTRNGTATIGIRKPLQTSSVSHEIERTGQSLYTAPPSLGSVGHPHSCAGACRYVKRKGGCKDGAQCPNCHVCFWKRDTTAKDRQDSAQQNPHIVGFNCETGDNSATASSLSSGDSQAVVSCGTRGHPFTCGAACKYVRRKGGCRDGAACQNCHSCVWRRNIVTDDKTDQTKAEQTKDEQADIFRESMEELQNALRNIMMNHALVHANELCQPCAV